jgi:hypothetical protein
VWLQGERVPERGINRVRRKLSKDLAEGPIGQFRGDLNYVHDGKAIVRLQAGQSRRLCAKNLSRRKSVARCRGSAMSHLQSKIPVSKYPICNIFFGG